VFVWVDVFSDELGLLGAGVCETGFQREEERDRETERDRVSYAQSLGPLCGPLLMHNSRRICARSMQGSFSFHSNSI
jgi:hypothetical protein